jgi:DNA-binding SARP family transcriptional activator
MRPSRFLAVRLRRDPIEIVLRLLGPFSVRRDGEEVEPRAFRGRLPQMLLRMLATHHGSPVAHDVLVEALWPERPPADPAANLHVLASRVRAATGMPWLVTATAGGYLLPDRPGCVVDAERFLAEVKAGRAHLDQGRVREALAAFETALARWVGEPLAEDLYADWAQPYRRLLHQERLRALEGTAAAALALGDPATALQRADQAVTAEPLRESAHLLRVRALAAAGDPAGAGEAFIAYRKQLVAETGMEPSAEASILHQRLLRGELSVAAPPPPLSRRRPSAAPVPSELPFVGRDHEVHTILHETGLSRVVLVEGAPGVGKSRLLAEVARRADRLVVSARAAPAERDDPWSLARHLLGEFIVADMSVAQRLPDRIAFALAEVFPEIEETRPVPPLVIEPDSRRALVTEGTIRLADAALEGRGLLLIDDGQWADASSLALLTRLRTRLPQAAMVLACRSDEARSHGPLRQLVRDLSRVGPVTRLTAEALTPAAVARLVTDPSLAAALADYTERTPMAIREVIHTLARDGVLTRRGDGRWAPSAPGVELMVKEAAQAGQRRAIGARVDEESQDAQDVLRSLALLGRETSARTLATAVGRSQASVLAQLDHLAHVGLARLGERGWATSHDLVADVVVAGCEPTDRGLLHGALARALADDEADRAEVARHLAGAGEAEAAARAYAEAAQESLARFADRETEQLATAGMALARKLGVRARLLEIRAECRARTGDLGGAGDDLRSALRAGVPGPDRARLLARHARLAAGAEDLAYAAELVKLALAETGGDPRARAAALYAGSIIDMNIDQPERARQRADEALRLYEELGDAHGVADILDARAMATSLDGRNYEAVEAFDRVARLFLDAGDLLRVVTPRSTGGHGRVFMGQPDRGLAETEQALELARSLDYSEGVAYALWHHSEALSALGRVDEAEEDAREAIRIAERLGHRSWTVAAHRALGVALQAGGDLMRAEQAFRRALDLAAHWPLFASWACARTGLVRLALGDPDGAEPYVLRALDEGPPLAHYEARLARANLAAARHEPDAAAIARDALERAMEGGHLVGVPRLTELARRTSDP